MSTCDPSDLFDPQGNDLSLDYDRGTDELPHAPVILPQSPCYGGRGVIKTHQGQTVDVILPVIDRTGESIPLASVPAPEPGSEESSSSADSGVPLLVRFHAKPSVETRTLTINKACTIYNAARGLVKCTLVQADLPRPGLQPAQLAIYSPDGERLLQVVPYWLHVSPSLQHSTTGPLTIQEVRMVVADRCPEANVLMDALEFDEEEIAIFIRRCVDEFNEKYQPPTTYTCQTFPWRFHWALGAAGHMLRSKAVQIRRNELHYQAGGVSIKDDEHAGDYFKIGTAFLDDWGQFVVSKKRSINFDHGYATQLSGYSYTYNAMR